MCTRIYINDEENDNTLTARNMDWFQRFDTNLWVFRAGVKRNSMPGDTSNGFWWESRFNSIGAVVTVGNKGNNVELISNSDGMNEAGLTINALYLAESDYDIQSPEITKNMSMGIWGQYLLDNYGSVKEAILGWVEEKAKIITMDIPSTEAGVKAKKASLHMSLSDKEGKSAIFEYYKEDDTVKLHITTNLKKEHLNIVLDNKYLSINYQEDCNIMTNSPNYSQQLQLNYFWQWQWDKGAEFEENATSTMRTHTLPGTHRAPDRFARTSFYLKHTDRQSNTAQAIGQIFSLVRQAAVPNGYRVDGQSENPNDSNTIWNVVSDHINKTYYFQSTIFPSLIWVDLRKVNFTNDFDAYKLKLHEDDSIFTDSNLAGNVVKELMKGGKTENDFEFFS